ncbi:MAG: alginate export family protein [Verrucomicrobia bacterium]|nr:alginate export family protein [Verrucomicrobiota bacterium]
MSPRCNLIIALFCAATAAYAQDKKAEPAPTLTYGADVRLRYEAYDSVQTLKSDVPFHVRDYFRLRLRAWVGYNAMPNLSLYGRIAAEPRHWLNNSTATSDGRESKYGLIDSLYAKWSTSLSDTTPVTVVLGRQDIQLGDQWLVGDGTPVDGSWTAFFDGLRATFDVKNIKTKFDVMAFKEQSHPRDHARLVGRQANYVLTEQDEVGAILYATNKSVKAVQLDGYFIYKEDKRVTSAGNTGEAYTLGTRIVGSPAAKWQYTAEAAYQWGSRDLQVRYPISFIRTRDISAYGFNAKLTYSLKDKLSNQFTLLTEYLSGDDPGSTDKDEMFDILWGRYPRLGETWAVAYSLESSGRNAQYQNLFRVGATWTISPTKNTSVATTYCALFAPEEAPTRATNAARFSRDGHFRGHMLQTVLKQKITKHISGLFFAEAIFLGDYYAESDIIIFLCAELTYTF